MAYKDKNGKVVTTFKGYLRMQFLDRDETLPDNMGITATEDWAVPKTKNRIIGKSRQFSINIHLFNDAGQKALSHAFMLNAGGVDELKSAITKTTVQMMKENSDQVIALYKSYAIVRV